MQSHRNVKGIENFWENTLKHICNVSYFQLFDVEQHDNINCQSANSQYSAAKATNFAESYQQWRTLQPQDCFDDSLTWNL